MSTVIVDNGRSHTVVVTRRSAGTTDNVARDAISAHEDDTANPHAVTKTQVGLGNVDNVQQQPLDSDLTAIAALDSGTAGALATDGAGWIRKTYAQLKTSLGLVKADVGLGNVDNTADVNKPVSTDQATADGLRVLKAGDSLSGELLTTRATAADKVLSARVAGDTNDRASLRADGSLWFGPGNSPAAKGLTVQKDGWTALGDEAGLNNANVNLTAVGRDAGRANTTGSNLTAFGANALVANQTGNNNTAVGLNALLTNVGGSNNTVVGAGAGLSVTGNGMTAAGVNAGQSPLGNAAFATTTGVNQTHVGLETGQGSATQRNNVSTFGYRATADGNYATALGTLTVAGAAGAVAIGCDSTGVGANTTTQDEIKIGTALHTVNIRGRVRLAEGTASASPLRLPHGVAPTSPVDGDIWTTTVGLFVRVNGATIGPLVGPPL